MNWDVEYTDEFGTWFGTLDASAQDNVGAAVEKLQEFDGEPGYTKAQGED